MAGKAENREFTTSFKPSFQLTTLNGLKARNAQRAFKLQRACPPFGNAMSTTEATTTRKSS